MRLFQPHLPKKNKVKESKELILSMNVVDCGSLAFTDEQVRETLRARRPEDGSIEGMGFGTIEE